MALGILLIGAILVAGLILLILKPPTAIVLALAGISIALIGTVPLFMSGSAPKALDAIFSQVIAGGMTRLSVPIIAVFLGAVIAQQVADAGVTSRILTYGAEFSGDTVFLLTVTLLAITALLFTNIGGLGAVIMVATTVVPLMLAMGLDKLTAGGVFLLGLSLGGILNPVNWQFYITILNLKSENIIPFALALFGVFFFVSLGFIAVRVHKDVGLKKGELMWLALFLLTAFFLGWLILNFSGFLHIVKVFLFVVLSVFTALLILGMLLRQVLPLRLIQGRVNAVSIFALIFPVGLILGVNLGNGLNFLPDFNLDIISALFLGVVFAHFSTNLQEGGEVNRLMRALYEGFKMALPAVLLLLAIGILLQATTLTQVAEAVQPLIVRAVPRDAVSYVIVLALLSPLSLYRGPLNLYGMGSGIMGLIMGTGALSPQLLMGAFFSVGMMQGVCDPTNTHNAWLAGFLGVRVVELTRVTICFVGIIVLLGLIVSQVMF